MENQVSRIIRNLKYQERQIIRVYHKHMRNLLENDLAHLVIRAMVYRSKKTSRRNMKEYCQTIIHLKSY